jgi:hypothetical protein
VEIIWIGVGRSRLDSARQNSARKTMIFLDHPFILSSYKLKKCAKNKQQNKLTKLRPNKRERKASITPGWSSHPIHTLFWVISTSLAHLKLIMINFGN